jgi:aspartyl-tRNA(Asn)/glutamyl-tRNA(Gln) amidotransferase subunit C
MEFGDLEKLAKVDLDEQERDRLRLQLDRVLGFVRKLQEIDTEGVVRGEAAPSDPAADVPGECLEREEVLAQAPDSGDGFFRVPAIIEREGGDRS